MLRDFLFSETDFQKLSNEQIESLVDFGADFHFAYDYFLKSKGVNKRFRLFIDAIFHLNKSQQRQIKDADLAELMGVSRETVGRIRKRFDKWQWYEDFLLIEITEGEYIRDAREKKKFIYSPNGYKITFAKLLVEAIFEARAMPLYQKNSTKAIKIAIDRRLSDISGNYKSQKRKPKTTRTVSEKQKTVHKQIATLAEKSMLLAEAQMDSCMEDDLEDLHEILESVFDALVEKVGNRISANLAKELQT